MTEECARQWGSSLGSLEGIEVQVSSMKVRVRIDITVPLQHGIRVLLVDVGQEVSLILQYERLPDFYYRSSS